MNSKYSNFLTILLIIIIVLIVGIIGFLGYRYYQNYVIKSNSENYAENVFNEELNLDSNPNNGTTQTPSGNDENMYDGVEEGTNTNQTGEAVQKFNGFTVAGTIEIPATNLNCPIISKAEYSAKALETSVVELYGVGLNKQGNTTIVGHNYRNGLFFSNNKKLNVGDKIFITDLTGKRLSYTIYDKFEAEENYSDYITRDTQGAIEISLSTCTDNSKARIIILAKADV